MRITRLSPAARLAQARARTRSCEFGNQAHTEAGQVTVPVGVSAAMLSIYEGIDLERAARSAAGDTDAPTVRQWAAGRHDGVDDG